MYLRSHEFMSHWYSFARWWIFGSNMISNVYGSSIALNIHTNLTHTISTKFCEFQERCSTNSQLMSPFCVQWGILTSNQNLSFRRKQSFKTIVSGLRIIHWTAMSASSGLGHPHTMIRKWSKLKKREKIGQLQQFSHATCMISFQISNWEYRVRPRGPEYNTWLQSWGSNYILTFE